MPYPLSRRDFIGLATGTAVVGSLAGGGDESLALDLRHGVMAGEVTTSSVILQTRLTRASQDKKVPGATGIIQFEVWPESSPERSFRTAGQKAELESDSIVKIYVDGLEPGVRYAYRAWFGPSMDALKPGEIVGRFRTLRGASSDVPTTFVVFSCMAYEQFFIKPLPSGNPYHGEDRSLGYPALVHMKDFDPDFAIGTGDAVYYDWVNGDRAQTREEMRRRWREQAILPRFIEFFSQVASYWQKDDHDYRFNDADAFVPGLPSPQEGAAVFLEQLPVVAPGHLHATYRTYRVTQDVQIWLMEGRDFRAPNAMPDGPAKTLWGKEQRSWLESTLLASDARHLLLVSPNPMVGPDFASKNDNHTNIGGFRWERDAFFDFVIRHNLTERLSIVCGDRHWPYHSVSKEGIHEFCSGVLTDGCEEFPVPRPGDPKSTDPDRSVDQRFVAPGPTASFLKVTSPGAGGPIRFDLVSSRGATLHTTWRV